MATPNPKLGSSFEKKGGEKKALIKLVASVVGSLFSARFLNLYVIQLP